MNPDLFEMKENCARSFSSFSIAFAQATGQSGDVELGWSLVRPVSSPSNVSALAIGLALSLESSD